MTLRLHPDLLAAGYDFLRQSDPFKGWRLPHSSKVKFRVIRTGDYFADFGMDGPGPIIRVSKAKNGHSNTLLATIAHECIHYYQALNGLDTKSQHNADFLRRAQRVCAVHGFDILTF